MIFNYEEAFDRNIGWVTEGEQLSLRNKRIAIAGLGGVGGIHLLSLVRLGIGKFNISDYDKYELVNFNRQVGATISSLDKDKAKVMSKKALDINPTLDIKTFTNGIDEYNIDEFLEGADIFVDGFDFFVPDIRAKVFRRCRELGIPAITAAPIGFSTSYIIFTSNSMSFDDYFRLEGLSLEEKYINFLIGVVPKSYYRKYLEDPDRLDLANKKGPSTAAGCNLCAGVVGAEVIKILLHKGTTRIAPKYQIFDAYEMKWKKGTLYFGNANPIQRFKRNLIVKDIQSKILNSKIKSVSDDASEIEQILDLARWAPSGDNSQPWKFKIEDNKVFVYIHNQADWNIFDYNNGYPSLLSVGMLLENIKIAASKFNKTIDWKYKKDYIKVEFKKSKNKKDLLINSIVNRSVNRNSFKLTKLSEQEKIKLEKAIGSEFTVKWFESNSLRWKFSKLNSQTTDLRLRMPETYKAHKQMFDWVNEFSTTGIPVNATGLDKLTLKIMKWGMVSWSRISFLNKYLGTFMARIQLDLIPGFCSAAHFAIISEKKELDVLKAGMAVQRFWLTATDLGLVLQPSVSTMMFAFRARHTPKVFKDKQYFQALKIAIELEDNLVFMGRIGTPKNNKIKARSVRKPLEELRNN